MNRITEVKQGSQIQKATPSPGPTVYEDMDRMFDKFL